MITNTNLQKPKLEADDPFRRMIKNQEEKPIVHDHYDGSAHCIECDGPCQLPGKDLHFTLLVRAIFEQGHFHPVFGQVERYLGDAGIDINYHRRRAKETDPFTIRRTSFDKQV